MKYKIYSKIKINKKKIKKKKNQDKKKKNTITPIK